MPNHGKPVVAGTFESVTWLVQMTVWITGEAELVAIRTRDGWNINRHYDLGSSDDLETALGELASPDRRGIGSERATGQFRGGPRGRTGSIPLRTWTTTRRRFRRDTGEAGWCSCVHSVWSTAGTLVRAG